MPQPNLPPGVSFIKAPGRDAMTDTSAIEATVKDVLAAVRRDGDAALFA